MSCDPQTLATGAACYTCVPDGYKPILNAYLLAQSVGLGGTSPQALNALAEPFEIFSGTMAVAAKTYLLALSAGTSTNPSTLANASSCFYCKIPTGFQQDVESYLYAQINDGVGVTLAANLTASTSYQVLYGNAWKVELYLLAHALGITNPQTVMSGAVCLFSCLSTSKLREINNYLLCLISAQGAFGNIVPSGALYSGATPTYTLTVNPNTTYVITWGANDLSMTMGGVTYTSTGAGTQTVVYTDSNTQMVFTGTFAGTTVTVKVSVAPPAKVPIPTGFALSTSGSNVTVSWNTPILTFVNYTEVWTSNDNVTFSLAATVNFPTASTVVTGSGSNLYVKIRWCSTGLSACGQFTNVLSASLLNSVVAAWANQVVTNGGAAPSSSTKSALSTFWNTIQSNSLDSLMIAVVPLVPDNLIAAITPLYNTAGNNPWTNHNFVAGDLTINGLVGNASTKFLDTGIVPSTVATAPNLLGGTIYISAGNSSTQEDMAAEHSPNFFRIAAFFTTNGQMCIIGGASIISPVVNNYAGFMSCNRTANNACATYTANSGLPFSNVASNGTTVDNVAVDNLDTIYAFGANLNGTGLNLPSSRRYSFFALHKPLSSAQAQIFYNAIQALRTALGGGFV